MQLALEKLRTELMVEIDRISSIVASGRIADMNEYHKLTGQIQLARAIQARVNEIIAEEIIDADA